MPIESDHLDKDLMGEIIWPEDVLVRAREAIIAYGYAPGAEEFVRAGKADHWHAMHVACHAICDKPRYKKKAKPKTAVSALTVEEELDEMYREIDAAISQEAESVFTSLRTFVKKRVKI